MNENEHFDHEPHPTEATGQPASPSPDDLETRLFDVALHQMRRGAEGHAEPPDDELDAESLANTLEQVRGWVELRGQFRDAYQAYRSLGLPLPDATSRTEDYFARYVGSAPNRASFVSRQLERLGLERALDELMREQGMRAGDVLWDEAVVWDHLCERYWVVEGFGGVHGFRR